MSNEGLEKATRTGVAMSDQYEALPFFSVADDDPR